MPFSTFLAGEILDWVTGQAFPTPPATLAVNVHDGSPGPAGASNSVQLVVTGSADRTLVPQLDLGGIVTVTPEGFEKLNTAVITITGAATNATPVTITHVSLWDAPTGGNMLFYDALAIAQVIQVGDLVKFDPTTFSVAAI